jgi:hypothetical protein
MDVICWIGITYSPVQGREERIEIPLVLPVVPVLASPTGVQLRGSNLTLVREFPHKTLLCRRWGLQVTSALVLASMHVNTMKTVSMVNQLQWCVDSK